MLTRSAPVAEGGTILVHPAAGGVGLALLQLGALRGLKMFGTASVSKSYLLAQTGTQHIDYRTQDYVQRIHADAPAGIDAVYDGVGGRDWKKDLSLLRPGGRLVVYGLSAGFKDGRRNLPRLVSSVLRTPRTSYLTYFRQSVGVVGYNSGAFVSAHPDLYREDLGALLKLLQDSKIAPLIGQTFALERAAQAHRDLGAGRAIGKILLTP